MPVADAALAREEGVADARAISARVSAGGSSGGRLVEAGRCGQARRGDRQRLEQGAHFSQVRASVGGRVRGRAACAGVARARARAARASMPRRSSRCSGATGRRPRRRPRAAARASAREIDMGGEIGLAGIGERSPCCWCRRTACRLSPRAAAVVAVVDDQRGAACRATRRPIAAASAMPAGRDLDDHALARRLRRAVASGASAGPGAAQREDEAVAARRHRRPARASAPPANSN